MIKQKSRIILGPRLAGVRADSGGRSCWVADRSGFFFGGRALRRSWD
jgi:hypothetical protein